MKTRVLTAIVALIIFVPVLVFADSVAFPLALALLAAISGYEFANSAGEAKKWYITLPTAAFCFIFAASARMDQLLPDFLPVGASVYFWLITLVAAYMFYMLCLTVFAFGKVGARQLMATAGMAVFAALAFYSFIKVRDHAVYDYLLILIAAWMTDTFAIFGGKLFGKKKLAPKLSPKKTVAGMISGVVGAMVGFLVYNIVVSLVFGSDVNYILRLALAIPASLISQVGDLAASAIKRDCGIKDYGKIFPGHGGVTDRFDSVMFLSVATFLFITAVKYFFPGVV